MVIYNAKVQQRWFTFGTGGLFSLGFLFVFFLGEMYTSKGYTLLILTIIAGTLLLSFFIYLLLIRFANSVFIFDETGFVRKINKKNVLEVKWEDVICIGTYQIYDFFKIDCGPFFLGIDYYDENHNEQKLNVAFSSKDAKKLRMSGLNEKLKNIRY